MGVGVVMYSFSQFFLKAYVEAGGGEYPHYLHIMAIIFLFNIGLMLLIGKLKPLEVAYEQQYTKQVDITEWKPVRVMGLVITIIVISTYFIFT
jgi:SSS family solute:Na+ symporter